MTEKRERAFVNNAVDISGEIIDDFRFDHSVNGKNFYRSYIECKRLSGVNDTIPIIVSDEIINVSGSYVGKYATVYGHYRSYNKRDDDGKVHLILTVAVKEIDITSIPDDRNDVNEIKLYGFLCKSPNYRKTPAGNHISDLMVAINRPHGKSDYIPCICWGQDAMFAANVKVGSGITICGRVQSREYEKKLDADNFETRTAYEVSVSNYQESIQ